MANYLMTDDIPAMLPQATGANGLTLTHSAAATDSLLDDLRSDKGMGWVPQQAWLSKIAIDAEAADLRLDLALDTSGAGMPSPIRAGLIGDFAAVAVSRSSQWLTVAAVAAFTLPFWFALVLLLRRRPMRANPA